MLGARGGVRDGKHKPSIIYLCTYSVATYLYIFEYNLVSGTTFAHQYNQGTYEMMFVFVLWNLFSKYITCETLNFHRIKF